MSNRGIRGALTGLSVAPAYAQNPKVGATNTPDLDVLTRRRALAPLYPTGVESVDIHFANAPDQPEGAIQQGSLCIGRRSERHEFLACNHGALGRTRHREVGDDHLIQGPADKSLSH